MAERGRSPALVDVRAVEPSILVDLRYAGSANVTGAPLPGYEAAVALLRPSAARALARVQRRLNGLGFGLLVWDAYRPLRATRAMVAWAEATGRSQLLEDGYIARDSRHNSGAAVDVTLVDVATGSELEMGAPFDTFSQAAHTASADGQTRWRREMLVAAMEAAGFENFAREWWHFDYPRLKFAPLDLRIR